MKRALTIIAIFAFFIGGCASIEGTRNKSYTYKQNAPYKNFSKIAIFPIEESSKFPSLPDLLEKKVCDELMVAVPGLQVLNSPAFSFALHQNGKLESFSSWYTTYKTTRYLDYNRLNEVTDSLDVQYLLSIRSLDIDREKIHAVDSGYSGMVSDANNVYRTNFKFIGELIDIQNRKIVWQGIGYSENINSPKRPLDLFFIIKNQKNPEIDTFLGEMVKVAAKGFVVEMTKREN
ncbi:MAG: hypothetical protein AB7D06_06380 [Pedobacter sp.]